MNNWKRILALLLILTMCFSLLPVSAFAGEPEDEITVEDSQDPPAPEEGEEDGANESCEHEAAEAVTENEVKPTCTAPGSHDEVVYCALCEAELRRETVEDPALGHAYEAVEAAEPTCTEPGHTAGVVCTRCGDVESGYEESAALGHTPGEAVTENEVKPTCAKSGSHDVVVYCSVCEAELSRQTVEDPATGHTPVDVEEVPAEVGVPGTKAGKKCAVCGEVLEGCEEIEALPEPEPEPEDERVRVEFVCTPEETKITVYAAVEVEEEEEPDTLPEEAEEAAKADQDSEEKSKWTVALDENGEPVVIQPEEDGSWLLLPGAYLYDAECEGYESIEKAKLSVEEKTNVTSNVDRANNANSVEIEEGKLSITLKLNHSIPYKNVVRTNDVANQYTIGFNVTVSHNSITSGKDNCWIYARDMYYKVWNNSQTYSNDRSASNNMLKALSLQDSLLTVEHLQQYISAAALGAVIRTSNEYDWSRAQDNTGHSQIIVQKDSNGFTVFESNINLGGGVRGSREQYYTWSSYISSWYNDEHKYIKYIKWPSASAFQPNTFYVQFNSSGGSTCSAVQINKNTAISFLPTPTLDGYEFDGWYTAPFGGSQVCVGDTISRDMTLYAHWTRWMYAQIYFNPNGGTLNDEAITRQMNGVDIDRSTGYLVVYKNTYPNTNSVGFEIAVDAKGKITGFRDYGSSTKVTKPSGGFVLSGHNAGGDFVSSIHNGGYQYVSVDYETGIVTAYKDYNSYLAGTKFLTAYDTYGELPVLTRDGYVFGGWYNVGYSPDNVVRFYTPYSGSNLVAIWKDYASAPAAATLSYNGHTYELFNYKMSWTQAEAFCQSRGGHLVCITDANEQAKVKELIQSSADANGVANGVYHIGLTKTSGSWKWVSGEALSFNAWDSPTEPTGGADELYAAIIAIEYSSKSVGEWIDESNYDTNGFYSVSNCGFICEKETVSLSGTCGKNGGNLTWTLDASGTLTISGTGEMADYQNRTAVPWYESRGSIKKIIMNSGVKSIGNNAFYDCNSLTSVTIPSSITAIGEAAFYYCYNLASVTIPAGVTSIGDLAFATCSNLTSVTIPASVISIGGFAFYNCKNLTSITLSTGVKSIGSCAFATCNSLTSVTIPSSITAIGEAAFSHCSMLTSITVDSGNTDFCDQDGILFNKGVTELIAFPGGRSGTYEIPAGVTSIYNEAFAGCSKLTNITIKDGMTSIGYAAFYLCSSLTIISIPFSVTNIGESAFASCSSLSDVYFSGTTEQWTALSDQANTGNAPLFNATIHILGYKISYDANGGTGAPAAQIKTHGTALTLSSTKPTRTGYDFLGWATNADATAAQYQPSDSYTTLRRRA